MITIVQEKSFTGLIKLSLAIFLLGALFKIQHWPGANVMICVASGALAIFYFMRYSQKVNKALVDHVKLALVLSWSLNSVFSILHLPYDYVFKIVMISMLVAWLLLEGPSYFKKGKPSELTEAQSMISTVMLTLAICAYTVGVLFKIMHWPFAGIILTIATLLGISWLIYSVIVKR